MMAPGATPKEIIARLNSEAIKAMGTPELRNRLLELGFEPRTTTPDEMRGVIAAEVALWAKVIRDSGAKIE
jgi:tripartite-type tricarboxylate transporter receptor subunit TctC